jgi:hypothetical protein
MDHEAEAQGCTTRSSRAAPKLPNRETNLPTLRRSLQLNTGVLIQQDPKATPVFEQMPPAIDEVCAQS